MPKRRMTPERKAQIRLWQAASHGRARSRTNPIPAGHILSGQLGRPATIPGSFGSVRRHKQGGKAYQKKSAGAVHISSEAKAIIAGHQGFRSQLSASMNHQGPAKVPKIKNAWRRNYGGGPHNPTLAPSKVHGSGTGLTAAFRYKGR